MDKTILTQSHISRAIQNKIFVGFLILISAHLIFVFTGFYGNDDINYMRHAAQLANEDFTNKKASNHFQLRWVTIYTTAFFYKLFGINSFVSTLSPFLGIILSGFLLKKILSPYPPMIFSLSLVLFFFSHSILFYMHRILPDTMMCFAILWMYSSYRFSLTNGQSAFRNGLQFSTALLVALMTKETIIIAAPLFLFLCVRDLFKRQSLKFWFHAILATLIYVLLYLSYFKITTGAFMYRFDLLKSGNYFSICSFDSLPLSFTIKRIGYELWRAMLLNGDLMVFIPAVSAWIYRKKIRTFVIVNTLDFTGFIVLLCCANFMTISFTSYIPLCQDPRHFLFLFPFAAIIGGPLLFEYLKEPAKFLLLPILMTIATCIAFYIGAGDNKYLYLLFSLLLLASLLLSKLSNHIAFKIGLLAFFTLFSLIYVIGFINYSFPNYWAQKKLVRGSISHKALQGKLFAEDAFSGELTEFFLKFKTDHLSILPMDSVKRFEGGNIYYLVISDINPDAQYLVDSLKGASEPTQINLVNREKNVSLYKIDNATLQLLNLKR